MEPDKTIIIPENVSEILAKHKCPPDALQWYHQPTLNYSAIKIPSGKIQIIDALPLIEPFFDLKELYQAFRMIDFLNGCKRRCNTCYQDASYPSKMFSYESLVKLFSNPKFLEMLSLARLHIGIVGDVEDYPQGMQTTKMILEATECLDAKRQKQEGPLYRHRVIVFTNFRPDQLEEMDYFLELARQNPDRLGVTVSLPFNYTDHINRQFYEYQAARPEYFQLSNIAVKDVRKSDILCYSGRVMPEEEYLRVLKKEALVYGNGSVDYQTQGTVDIVFNSDGPFVRVQLTTDDSYTARIFAPLTKENLAYVKHLPWRVMSHTPLLPPPNWPGGGSGVSRRMILPPFNKQRLQPRVVENKRSTNR